MRIAFIVDPLDGLKAYKDSSIAMMRAAARRGHTVSAIRRADLVWESGAVSARALALAAPLSSALKDLEAVVCHQPSFDPFTDVRTFQLAVNDTAMVVIGLPLIEELAAHAWPGVPRE